MHCRIGMVIAALFLAIILCSEVMAKWKGGWDDSIGVIIPAVLLLVILAVWYIEKEREQQRSKVLATLAKQVGLEFSEKSNPAWLERMQGFNLFNKTKGKERINNVMQAVTDTATLRIFDYHSQHGRHKRAVTVVSMESTELQLPQFLLTPEGFFSRVGAMLGFQDIDFEENTKFSRAFVLKGEDEPTIRNFFDMETRDFFSQRKGIYVEGHADCFIYLECKEREEFLIGRRMNPVEIRDFMTAGYEVYAALKRRSSTPGHG